MPPKVQMFKYHHRFRFLDRFKERPKEYVKPQPLRLRERREKQLQDFEAMAADGVSFQVEERLPPWKQRAARLEATENKRLVAPRANYAGIQLRLGSNPSGEADGFPTHFQ